MSKIRNADGLSGSQVLILNTLAKSSVGMTDDEITFHANVPVNVNTIGPVYGETIENHPNSLRGRGLVVCEKEEDGDVRWRITTKGRELGKTLKGNRIGPSNRVPNDILDPVAGAFKRLRSYPFEEYTKEDMTELRARLPKEFHSIDLDELRRQAQARRKQGVFSDPNERRDKALRRIVREFGADGTIFRDFLTEDQLGTIYGMIGDVGSSEE